MNKNEDAAIENAGEVIQRFGGIRPMANKMDVPVTTVQGWKKRDVIPANRRSDVLDAAREHDVDLSGLQLGGTEANENVKAEAPKKETEFESVQDFPSVLKEAVIETSQDTERRHEEAVEMAEADHSEVLMRHIHKTEKAAVRKSLWISAGFIVLVCAGAAVLLWPIQQKVESNGARLTTLEGEVSGVKEKQGFFEKIIPENLQEKLAAFQKEAKNLQGTMDELSERADIIANEVLAEDAGPMSARLARLEEQVAALTGEGSSLSVLMDRMNEMQKTLEGQEMLTGALEELRALVTGLQGDMQSLEPAIEEVQMEGEGPLGETLEGVSKTDLKAAAMLMGLNQFRYSLRRGEQPFEEDLVLLQDLVAKNDPELNAAIERLAPKAREGVLSTEGLKDEFKGLTGDIVVASLKGEDVSMQDRAKARFNEMLSVQKDGELVTGTETQAVVARAQKMLDEGDIEGAVETLKTLDGEAAETAKPWIDEAEMTMLAKQIEAKFNIDIMSYLQKTGHGADIDLDAMQGVDSRSLNLDGLTGKIKSMTPDGHVVRDEESGLSIYKKPTLPDLSDLGSQP